MARRLPPEHQGGLPRVDLRNKYEVIDIGAVAELAHAVGACLVVDNIATPVFMRCLSLGADVVIYSATKHIDGQGRCLGGVVLGSRDYIRGTLEPFLKHTGGALSPFNAWVMLKGMETLDLRCRAQAETAAQLAGALHGHPALARVIYPGLPDHPQAELSARQMETGGTVLSLDLAGGKTAAFHFLDALEIVLISNNLGNSKSLVAHRRRRPTSACPLNGAPRSASATGWCGSRSGSKARRPPRRYPAGARGDVTTG